MTCRASVVCVVLCVLSSLGLSVGFVTNRLWFGCPIISPEATCPDSQYITFYLHTRSNPTTAQTIDLGSNNLTASNFVASKPTKIIIHGLNDTSNSSYVVAMRKELLVKDDYNIISVDWAPLAKGDNICFPTANSNAVHVGVCTGGLINALRLAGNSDIHIIGHSLGAHVMGVAANSVLPNKVDRMTVLDPAQWFFTSSPSNRLRPGLAHFVDAIHTALNNLQTLGHVDYYVNGGYSQPGCAQIDPDKSTFVCNHERAVFYFIESINTPTGFYGWECPDYSAIYGGVCFFHGDRTVLMGYNASNSTRGVIQVKTNPTPPFAMGRD